MRVEITVKTPHGERVKGATVRASGAREVRVAAESPEGGRYALNLSEPGDYNLVVERFDRPGGFDHRTFRTSIFYATEGESKIVLRLRQPEGEVACASSEPTAMGWQMTIVLDYLWFTPIGFPPTQGNQVALLADGDAGWGAVAALIREAKQTVHLTTWIYEPTAELLRPDPLADPSARVANTVGDLLAHTAERGVDVRLLLWDAPVIDIPDEAERAARTPNDHFEVLEQSNPHATKLFPSSWGGIFNDVLGGFHIGSYHQKAVVVDGRVAFCGGMNLKENDWDSCRHSVFDARRCKFERDRAHRETVHGAEVEPDHPPRHDFVARVEGPAVAHLEANFRQRWNYLVESKAEFAENASPVAEPIAQAAIGTSQVQVVRTMPEPFDERGILDVYLRAVGTARKLIYIEDQYFRSIHLSDAIADTVRSWPDIKVIVVTAQGEADGVFTGGWSRECFEHIARRLPGFELYALRAYGTNRQGETVVRAVDNHAKLMIVDDRFLTVGSCNINDRGFEYEGELNVAVVDPDLVAKARLEIFREHLGDDPRLNGEIINDVRVWTEHARHNASASAPKSHVFPFKPDAGSLIFVNEDVF